MATIITHLFLSGNESQNFCRHFYPNPAITDTLVSQSEIKKAQQILLRPCFLVTEP
jgi:hypothetical protein